MSINRLLILLITLYQRSFSYFWSGSCRFYPSCSEYSKQCYQSRNFLSASALTVSRLCRCNPFHPGGVDVP